MRSTLRVCNSYTPFLDSLDALDAAAAATAPRQAKFTANSTATDSGALCLQLAGHRGSALPTR